MFKGSPNLFPQIPISFHGISIVYLFLGFRISLFDYVSFEILVFYNHPTLATDHLPLVMVDCNVSSTERAFPLRVANTFSKFWRHMFFYQKVSHKLCNPPSFHRLEYYPRSQRLRSFGFRQHTLPLDTTTPKRPSPH